MALIGFSVYDIDFYILENNNPKTLVLFDQSTYLDDPEKPIYSIKLPGYPTGNVISYTPNQINILNSNILKLTTTICTDCLADLPDGVYEITQAVCPYDELYKTKLYLRTTKLDCLYKQILLVNFKECCLPKHQIEKELIHIDILIQSAKAEAENHNAAKAQEKYAAASQAISNFKKHINCN